MKKVCIVGFGRFGQLLADILKDDFDVSVVEPDQANQDLAKSQGFDVIALEQIKQTDVIFLAVPIAVLESAIKNLAPIVQKHQLVMDICAVKFFPVKLMQTYLPNCQTLATHPIFGPDSAKNGLKGLKLVFCKVKADEENVTFWQSYWQNKGVQVITMTPEKHDHDIIYSLGLTQILSRLLADVNVPELTLSSPGFDAIKRVTEVSLRDTDQLFHDMLYYNPFLRQLKDSLEKSSSKIMESLTKIVDEQDQARTSSKD